ncbi:MAG: hypothetical protein ABSH21_12200 [Verrucomicrobiia bacterium]
MSIHPNHIGCSAEAAVDVTADSILLFGPGEAKGELKKRLERDNLGGRIVAIQTVDKMTDRQVAAKVHEYFHE